MTTLLFRTHDIANDYQTRVRRTTVAIGHLFEAKRFRVVERTQVGTCGYRIGIPFSTTADLPRTITMMIDYAHELGKRTTVYNLHIGGVIGVSGERTGTYRLAAQST